MNFKVLPPRVRTLVYMFWAGIAVAGAGIVGFFSSVWSIPSPAQAEIGIRFEIPAIAYVSIFAWAAGLLIMWYSRRRISAALAEKVKRDNEA